MYKFIDFSKYSVNIAWVKNVYRQPYNWFKQCVVSSPICMYVNNNTNQGIVKLSVIQLFIQSLNKFISTVKNSVYNLLINSYTHNPQNLLLEPLKIY